MFDQIFDKIFDQVLTRVLGSENTVYSSTGTEKYSVQFYWDGEIQCTVLLGQKIQCTVLLGQKIQERELY